MYSQITGICISASDNSGKRKRTFKDFPQSVTNGKFYAEKNEFEFVSHGKYSIKEKWFDMDSSKLYFAFSK